ncbi:MAG: hypothetical protein WCK46_01765 [Candidatus Adlerbacteria bacterium]
MAAEKKDSIDGLKTALYSRKDAPTVDTAERTPLTFSDVHTASHWTEPVETPTHAPAQTYTLTPRIKKPGMSFTTKFFIGSVVFFCVAAAAAAYMLFVGGGSISPQNIDLQVVMPSVVDGGKATTLQVLINNRNQANLKLVDLIINYPVGTRDPLAPSQGLTHDRVSIGSIAAGQQLTRTAQAIFYGQEGTPQDVTISLQYNIEGSNAVFEKEASTHFTVGSSPISINVSAPSEAIAGQQFAMDLTVQSNALTPVSDVVIQAQYPFGFTLAKAAPAPVAGGTVWRLGTMSPGVSKTIHIVGTIDGQDGDARVFYFLGGSDSDQTDTQIKVPFLSVPQTLTVRRAFISADIAVNGKTNKTIAVTPGGLMQGIITWTNNLPDSVSNVEATLSLSGPMLDTGSVLSQNGFYQSANSTITWSKDQEAALASVPPGGTGTLTFTFTTLPTATGGTLYSNPTIDLALKIKGVRQGQDNVPQTVSSAATTQLLVSSIVALTAKALHFSGSLQNVGPMPPVADQRTSYTVAWTVTNSSNTIANGVVSATLPPYVTFIAAPAGSGVTYDGPSRTVTWALGDIKAGAGYSAPTRTVQFQVGLSASLSQVGQSPALTSGATLSGQDRFAQIGVQVTAEAPTTALQEAGFSEGMGVVAPKQ